MSSVSFLCWITPSPLSGGLIIICDCVTVSNIWGCKYLYYVEYVLQTMILILFLSFPLKWHFSKNSAAIIINSIAEKRFLNFNFYHNNDTLGQNTCTLQPFLKYFSTVCSFFSFLKLKKQYVSVTKVSFCYKQCFQRRISRPNSRDIKFIHFSYYYLYVFHSQKFFN